MTKWKVRRDDSPTLTTVLASGELGYDSTSHVIKIGDGSTPWSALPYFVTSSQRGVFGGGYTTTHRNTIDCIKIPEKSNATDFGDLIESRYGLAACSNCHGDLGIS